MTISANTIFSALSNIAGLLLGTNADTVAIFDSNLQQVFVDARPLKVEVKETSKIMEHPTETGVIIADNHIINPVEINLLLFVQADNFNAMYGQLKQAFVSATLFSVQTRTGGYQNMVIADMPHTEDAEIYNGIVITLHMKQIIFVLPISVSGSILPANFSPASLPNTNTIQAGIKSATGLSAAQTGQIQSIFTGVGFKALGKL